MTSPAETPETMPRAAAPDVASLRERRRPGWHSEVWSRRDVWLLALVTVVAGALRLWHVQTWSLSPEEAETWRASTESLGGRTGLLASERGNYPVVFFGLRWLMELGGLPSSGEGWLRLPFAFFGILCVPMLALVGDLLVGRRTALLAAGLLAVHPWHLEISQSASGVGVGLFFGLLGAGLVAFALRARNLRAGLLGVAVLLLAAGCDPSASLFWLVILFALSQGLLQGPRQWLALSAVVGLPIVVAVWRGGGVVVLASPPGLGSLRASELLAAVVGLLLLRGERWLVGLGAGLALPIGVAWLFGLLGAGGPWLALPALPAALLLASHAALRGGQLVNEALGGAMGANPTGASAALGAPRRPLGRFLGCLGLPGSLLGLLCGVDLAITSYLYTTIEHGQRAEWRPARDLVLREVGQQPQVWVLAGEGYGSLMFYLRPNHWRNLAIDAHPGRNLLLLADGNLANAMAPWRATAAQDLFVVLLRREVLAIQADAAQADLLSSFRVVGVLPGAFAAPEDTLYVYRVARPQAR